MIHEDLKREEHIEGSTDRAFGFVFAAVFCIIAAWPLMSAAAPRWWAFVVAGVFAALALARPALLAPLNRQWLKLGLLLGKIVSPIALGVVFYAVLMPIGLLMRLTGKDPLRLRFERDSESYWIARRPPGPPPQSMTNQF
ncbi:MAG TPA: SxtJ family membrane protein [Burkholderiales bacterium]|nr:SxtJ family membrane protein [Burkholderiales bacterium]